MRFNQFIGIDISKASLDICLFDGMQILDQFTCINSIPEIRKLFIELKTNLEWPSVLICAEHTGIYSSPLIEVARDFQAPLWLENPAEIKLRSGVNRGKNNRIDSIRIASYAQLNNSLDNLQTENEQFNLRDLIGQDYLIDDPHSYLGFKIKYFGFSPVRGRFDEFDGTLFYDGSNISSLSTSVFIDVNTINTGNHRRDTDLKSEGTWFDAENFPIISFVSTQVLPKPNGAFDLIGNLTIKGIALSDTISFDRPSGLSKDWAGNDQIDFSGEVTINRQDYKVFGGDFWSSIMENGLTQLSDEVEIEIDMHCRKADYQVRYDTADSLDVNKKVLDLIQSKGIDQGINFIGELHQKDQLTAGNLSSIGYTLNVWGLHQEALAVFEKRLALYQNLNSTLDQLGITYLYLNNSRDALKSFKKALGIASDNSRAF